MKKRLLALALCMVLIAVPVISSSVASGDAGVETYKFIFEDEFECN